MPKDIGELEADGDASANTQPDGTDPEPPKFAKKSEENTENTAETSNKDVKPEGDATAAKGMSYGSASKFTP